MHKAYLSIGSNIGDRLDNLTKACKILGENEEIQVLQISPVYETEPVGYDDQPYFLNIAVEIETTLDEYDLLDFLHDVENNLHRVKTIRFGPRTIDLDILLYDDLVSDDPILTIPHPRMYERAFVLMPLSDIMELGDDVVIPEDKSVVKTELIVKFEV